MQISRFYSAPKARLYSNQTGFTMIELLVVIAVIGVLAVAVLSSINPIEQINKGRDTRVRSNAAQLINAIDRFYAIQELYPWNDATYETALGTDDLPSEAFPDDTACPGQYFNGTTWCVIGGPGYPSEGDEWLAALSSTEEVKASFIGQLSDTSVTNIIYLYKEEDGDVYACFTPSSKQFQLEAVDGCDDREAILPDGACPQEEYSDITEWENELICLP